MWWLIQDLCSASARVRVYLELLSDWQNSSWGFVVSKECSLALARLTQVWSQFTAPSFTHFRRNSDNETDLKSGLHPSQLSGAILICLHRPAVGGPSPSPHLLLADLTNPAFRALGLADSCTSPGIGLANDYFFIQTATLSNGIWEGGLNWNAGGENYSVGCCFVQL